MEFILASGSPRRKELLSQVVKNFSVLVSPYDESILQNKLKDPKELVKKLSYGKANAVLEQYFKNTTSDFVIIGADTTVSTLEGEILGKPHTEQRAIQMLTKLQNQSHHVYTGMTVLVHKDQKLFHETTLSSSVVSFKPISQKEMREYIATKEPLDKAGSYAIQGIGRKFVKKYEGDFNSIVGLDTALLTQILKKFKVI